MGDYFFQYHLVIWPFCQSSDNQARSPKVKAEKRNKLISFFVDKF